MQRVYIEPKSICLESGGRGGGLAPVTLAEFCEILKELKGTLVGGDGKITGALKLRTHHFNCKYFSRRCGKQGVQNFRGKFFT